MLIGILAIVIVFILLLLPFILIGMDVMFFVKGQEKPIFELMAFLTGGLYVMMALVFWELPPWNVPLNRLSSPAAHEPFSSEHFIAIGLFALWGFSSYFLLKFAGRRLAPLVEAFLLAGVYVGCGLCLVWMFQLVCGAHPEGLDTSGSDVFFIFCLCVLPGIYLLHAVHLMVRLIKEKALRQQTLHYENPFMQRLNLWFLKGANLFLGAVVALLPVLGLLTLLLILFGQQPDSILLAFTRTSDWILSAETAPPPVEIDTHYLCTVSLRGHRRLVRPLRYGVRKGARIMVNRQLCVANAFEQLLMEKAPSLHRRVRHFYDTYGYPLSRHITGPWQADLVYLLMKPLEWVFLGALYLLDEKPENRICGQYLPQAHGGKHV